MSRVGEHRYRPAWWLPNGHAQTIWGRFTRRRPALPLRRETLRAPDGDELELHVLDAPATAPRVLVLHGLEGTIRSHYLAPMFENAAARGWGAVLLMHRGCGDAPNVARRFYHSGETSDLALVFAELAARHPRSPWALAGVSLGGNVLLKWLGELGAGVDPRIRGAAAISVPFDLELGARQISTSLRGMYDRAFLGSLRRKALAKLDRYPDLFDRDRLLRARNIFDFDDSVTAPVHGFADARDYYSRSSSIGFLEGIRVPTFLLSALDDPFLPPPVLGRVREIASNNPQLHLEVTERGGHVGFVEGRLPWRARYYAEARAFGFLDTVLPGRDYD
jgi:predicted alpha/beta-fold hydrolase